MKNKDRIAYNTFFYIIFTPALLLILFLTTYPIGTIIYDSFFSYDFISGEREFIGLHNYIRIIGEELFHRSFTNTLLFTFGASFAEVFLGVLMAFLLHRNFWGKRGASLIIIFPMIISTMVICAVWQTFFHYEIGLFNYLLRMAGFNPVGWLTNKDVALVSIILCDLG